MLQTWLKNPFNTRPLSHIWPSARPLLDQLAKSNYVFFFNLPWPLPLITNFLGHYWGFRVLNAASESNDLACPVLGTYGWELLASSLGPSLPELSTSIRPSDQEADLLDLDFDDHRYPISVASRVASGGWYEKTGLYRDNLFLAPWNKSLQLGYELNKIEQAHASSSTIITPTTSTTKNFAISSTSATATSSCQARRRSSLSFPTANLLNFGPPGRLVAATTVVWGEQDAAINTTLAVDGIADFFTSRDSQLVLITDVGHWTPLSREACGVWEAIIDWATKGENGSLHDALIDYPTARITVST